MQKGPPTHKTEIQAFLTGKKNVQRLKCGKMTGLFRKKIVWICFVGFAVVVLSLFCFCCCCFFLRILQKNKKSIPVVLFCIIPCERLWSANISLQESVRSDLFLAAGKDQHLLLYFWMKQFFSLSLGTCLYSG